MMSFATYQEATSRRGGPPFSIATWLADFPDPSNFLDVRFHSRMISPEGFSNNDSFFADPETDQLLDQARRELDPARRAALYRRVERILYDQAPWIWAYHPKVMEVVQPYVRGFTLHPLLVRDFRRVWLDR
jgi:ABC-type transport system substrate-binding protein